MIYIAGETGSIVRHFKGRLNDIKPITASEYCGITSENYRTALLGRRLNHWDVIYIIPPISYSHELRGFMAVCAMQLRTKARIRVKYVIK